MLQKKQLDLRQRKRIYSMKNKKRMGIRSTRIEVSRRRIEVKQKNQKNH